MIAQTIAITSLNLRNIPQRWASSLVVVIGLAGVVAVFSALLAMSSGFWKRSPAASTASAPAVTPVTACRPARGARNGRDIPLWRRRSRPRPSAAAPDW